MTYESFKTRVKDIDKTVSDRDLKNFILKLSLAVLITTASVSLIVYTCTRGSLGVVLFVCFLAIALFSSICKYASTNIDDFNATFNIISRFWAIISLVSVIVAVVVKLIV